VALIPAALLGCGGGSSGDDDDDDATVDALPAPGEGFQIITPDIVIEPGQEITYCYYTTVTLEQAAGIKKWDSVMTPGSHHLIVFFTSNASQPDGTLSSESCGIAGGGSGLNFPIWSYASQEPVGEMAMPDGVGMQIAASQHMFIQMHYLNTNPNESITVHATLNGETYAADEQYTPASAYVTYSTDISIGAGVGTTGSNEHTCSVPSGATFFTLGTHSHRRSVETWVKDGNSEVFRSDDWEHPRDLEHRVDAWAAAPYYQFSGDLTYHCDYENDLDQAVTSGDSANVNEMCMAVGYYFPATTATFCINGQTF
jgi:hypothetical protein